MADYDDLQRRMARIVARAWADEDYKRRLLTDPAGVLAEEGIEAPPGAEVRILEDKEDVVHVVLPAPPPSEVREEDVARKLIGPLLTCWMGYGPGT